MDPISRAKAVLGACLAFGAADLAVIDLRLAPALATESTSAPASAAPIGAPEGGRVSALPITRAAIDRPPAAAQAADTMREEYTVLFATDNARLDASALRLLDAIGAGGVVEVSVDGYADPRGKSDYNQALSEKRAAAIAEALAARGIVARRVRGLGATRKADGTADADALRRDRRVEVHIARRVE